MSSFERSSRRADAALDVAQPPLPPAQALEAVARMRALLALGDLRGAGVAAVADGVDQLRLREQPLQGRALGDREAAHLDQPRLALLGGQRPEQVEEQVAAGELEVERDRSARTRRRRRRSARGGTILCRPRTLRPKASRRATTGRDLAGADPPPPELLQLLEEGARRRRRRRADPGSPAGCSGSGTRSAPARSASGRRAGARARACPSGRCRRRRSGRGSRAASRSELGRGRSRHQAFPCRRCS